MTRISAVLAIDPTWDVLARAWASQVWRERCLFGRVITMPAIPEPELPLILRPRTALCSGVVPLPSPPRASPGG